MENLLNKIHFADCLDVLRQLPDRSVDLLLQDPPYGSMQCDWDKSVNIIYFLIAANSKPTAVRRIAGMVGRRQLCHNPA